MYFSWCRWLEKLGLSAQRGIGVVMRQTLYGYNYALLDIDMNPNPVRTCTLCISSTRLSPAWHVGVVVVVVVIARRLVSFRQFSRLRKSATAAGPGHPTYLALWVAWGCSDSWTDALRSVVPLHTPDTGDACLVTVQEPTMTGTQLGKCGTDWPREQIFVGVVVMASDCLVVIFSFFAIETEFARFTPHYYYYT